MRNARFFISLCLTALLTSCARAPTPPAFALILPTAAPTTLPAFGPTLAPSATQLPDPTVTAPALAMTAAVSTRTPGVAGTPLPAAHLKLDCLDVLDERPARLASSGQLVLANASDNTFYLDLATGVQTAVNRPDELRVSFAVSPDRRWLAYRRVIRDEMRIQTLENSLVIAAADDEPVQVIPWDAGWSEVTGWLDQDRLVINMAGRNPAESTAKKPATLSILTLSTGRVRVLRAEYPQIYTEYPVPNWDQWGVTVYDTSLTRVVYAYDSLERFDAGFTLWDVPNKRALVNVPATSLINTPRWSPDGSRFVVAANTGTEADWLSFELYSAGRDGGDVQRLTYLTEHYAKVFIQSYTWSPDGRWLAFWLVADPEGVPFIEHGQAHLALLDTTTGQVTNTCLPGEHDASAAPARVPPPLWSPDSQQLVLENSTADGKSRVILLDLATGAAAIIAENVRPEGWLLEP